ncbi:Cytochrome P450 3A24, partial [Tetrabaena socialis]
DEPVGGALVARGCTLVVSLFSMHRHPAIWPAPDEWLPQRWPNAFLPFGLGPRGCIGRNFALLNMQ